MRLWVRLTFGQTYPQQRHLVAKCDNTSGQFDIWSDLWVSLTFAQTYPFQAETSCGQVWYYFGSGWHLVRSLGQVDIWSDIPLILRHLVAKYDTTFGSWWHLVRSLCQVDMLSEHNPLARDILWPSVILLQVRLTCALEGKSGASSHSNSSSISIY